MILSGTQVAILIVALAGLGGVALSEWSRRKVRRLKAMLPVQLLPNRDDGPPTRFLVKADTPQQAVRAGGIPALYDAWIVVSLEARPQLPPDEWEVVVHYRRDESQGDGR